METYNRTEITKRAWRILRRYPNLTWSVCMKRSWAIEKNNILVVPKTVINTLLNNLRVVRIQATQEHFKILNSKKGKAIMKLDDANETKQMVEEGIIPFGDILHQRRLESKKIINNSQPIKRERYHFRNVDIESSKKIDIEQWIC